MALALAGVLGLTGCGGSSAVAAGGAASVSSPTSATGFRGDTLPQPVQLTSADAAERFTSTAGGTTTLGALQHGHVMLVYYGYTHCPDVCPTTMADLGVALRKASPSLRRKVQVVFITSDPQRDTAPVMSAWLAHFDYGLPNPFVGLTASLEQIDAVAKTMGVPLSPPVVAPNGTVTVNHGAQTLPFVDGRAALVWLASTAPDDYLHDLQKLVGQS
ncbi:MAG TPA: SCO family protein [Blastococcus sp.]|nr:SCO family protein [Blastococcus sp.]